MRKRQVLFVAAATTAALLLLGAVAAAAVVLGGLYPVQATQQHWQPTHQLLELAMHRSARLRARNIAEPPLADAQRLLRGAGCFAAKCVQCHGAPGVAQGDIGKSMQPLPGPLVDAARDWRPRELYWVTRNGIKMSGMPAWEYRLSESELWDVVAFMTRLPELSAPAYADWVRRASALPACGRTTATPLPADAVVDVERGRQALQQYACTACHMVPGVTGSRVHVGPPLDGLGHRQLIAGVLANTQENRERWILHTQQVKPGTAMPELGVAPQDARDMAAYLGTLK